MPIHDWTKVGANRFHHFHQSWIQTIGNALNGGILPEGYFALAEQKSGGPIPDVITVSHPPSRGTDWYGGVALADAPLKVKHKLRSEAGRYAERVDRLSIRHADGEVVSVLEIVSPGNKDTRHAIKTFARKAVTFLDAGISLLVVDLFPPSRRDPQGIHKVIWDRIKDEDFELPPDKRLTLASYSTGREFTAYVEPVGVGGSMMDMPIFLSEDRYVSCPLQATYDASWAVFPKVLKGPLEAEIG